MKEFVKMECKSDMELICVAKRGRNYGGGTMQQLETAPYPNKTNCLTTVAKDNLILQRPRRANKGVVHIDKSLSMEATETRIRRLTPTECARLQTIPDWYKWTVSETQQYKMLGNGWTVDIIKHILSFLPDELKK